MRIRIDHMLGFNWKFLTPLAFTLLMVTALMNALLASFRTPGMNWIYVLGMFLSNIVVGSIALEIARSYSRKERQRVEGPKAVAEIAQH